MIFSRIPPAFALFALFGMAAPTAAQTAPQYDRSQLEVGAAYSWESSLGISNAVNRGFDGEAYLFEVTDRAEDGSEVVTLYATNQQGRLLWDSQDGDTLTFQPNDCSFVEGDCTYQILSQDRVRANLSSSASYQDGIWIHIVDTNIDGAAPYTSYVCGIYDQDSIIQALYAIDSNSYTPYWMRITSGPNAAESQDMLARVTDVCQRAKPIS